MSVTIHLLNNQSCTLDNVQAVVLTGPHEMIVRCFGNSDVMWRNVKGFEVLPFAFPE